MGSLPAEELTGSIPEVVAISNPEPEMTIPNNLRLKTIACLPVPEVPEELMILPVPESVDFLVAMLIVLPVPCDVPAPEIPDLIVSEMPDLPISQVPDLYLPVPLDLSVPQV